MPGKCSHSCPLATFLPSLLLALLFMAASSSYPTRSSERARNAATQISTTLRTSPLSSSEVICLGLLRPFLALGFGLTPNRELAPLCSIVRTCFQFVVLAGVAIEENDLLCVFVLGL